MAQRTRRQLTCTASHCSWQRVVLTLCVTFHLSTVAVETSLSQELYFDPSPLDQNAVEGSDVTLHCDVSNRQHIVFRWTFNNQRMRNDSRRFMQDSDLRITSVEGARDSGVFHCIATNVTSGHSRRSSGATLNVLCEYQMIYISFVKASDMGVPR